MTRSSPTRYFQNSPSVEPLRGIVTLRLAAAFDAQHGGFATGWSPVSWGAIDELFVNLNALAESVIGLYKTEVIRRKGPWRTLEAVEFATLTWVDWFNTQRLLGPLGDVPPVEFEAQYYAQATVA